jgi:hypothetical protein
MLGGGGLGLASILFWTLLDIEYSVKNGFIPVVDLQSFWTMYLNQKKIGLENAWEYFFEQPCGYSLDDIKKSKNVILGGINVRRIAEKTADLRYAAFNQELLAHFRSTFKKYVRLKKEVAAYIQNQYESIIGADDVVLGVLGRGTDYVNNRPKGHPVQPSAEDLIAKSAEFFEKYNCTKIFLATEDQRIWDAFEKKFGKKVVTNEHKLFDGKSHDWLPNMKFDRENDEYLKGLEYLTTIEILSRSRYLVAGCCNGTTAALYISEGFEDKFLFDLGLYE